MPHSAKNALIDLHVPDIPLGRYVAQHYRHLSPPMNPAMRARMQDWGDESVREPRQSAGDAEAAAQRWLDTPRYAICEASALDRARGTLLGLAIGDAIGTTLQGQPRGAAQVQDMVGGGPYVLEPGEWTAPTSTALCLADALIADRNLVPANFSVLLIRWYRLGLNSVNGQCIDIGNTTRNALEAREAYGSGWQGNIDSFTAGNGALVRLAPLAIAGRGSMKTIWRASQAQSLVTHGVMESMHGCKLLGMVLCHALLGASREQAFAAKVAPFVARVQIINAGEYKEKRREQIRSSGYVIDTLEAALWAVWSADSFEEAILNAANLGGAANGVTAVAGQLAGALHGLSGIPQRWVNRVAWSTDIQRRADELFRMTLNWE